SLPLDKEATGIFMRGGKEQTFRAKPIERDELNPKQSELKQWGLTVRNLSFLTAKEMKRTNTLGVLVTSVRPGGPAGEAKPALDARDVLTEVNGERIKNVAALDELTRKI